MRFVKIMSAVLGAMLLLTVASASAAPALKFDHLVPSLKPHVPSDQVLAGTLAPSMLEQAAADTPSGKGGGYTFFGQFVDHDLTLDATPFPARRTNVNTLRNLRNPILTLDSVYGGGPSVRPDLYVGAKFKLSPDGQDLPRNPNGTAIISDGRNDENMIVSQIHLAFLKIHNGFVDQGMTFAQAQAATIARYQAAVLNDFLPTLVSASDIAWAQVNGPSLYKPGNASAPKMPVEFAVAAFRFGHSMVRSAYRMAENGPGVQVFDGTEGDLHGGRPIPPEKFAYWPNFLQFPAEPPPANIHRKIDTILSPDLFQLPIPSAITGGPSSLAERNLIRSARYDLPSGQDLSEAVGAPRLTNAQIGIPGGPYPDNEAPSWYYILAEANLSSGGAQLGPTGGRIVASVILQLAKQPGPATTIDELLTLSGISHRNADAEEELLQAFDLIGLQLTDLF